MFYEMTRQQFEVMLELDLERIFFNKNYSKEHKKIIEAERR